MKKVLMSVVLTGAMACSAAALEPIELDTPRLDGGKSLMRSLAERESVRSFSPQELSTADLSDLLWAANGISRPETGKRTAPSAMDRRDVLVYVVTARGGYVYNAEAHRLDPVAEGDFRQGVGGNIPPVNLVLVSADPTARFAEINAGYVAQNIYLACTSLGLATVSAGTMDAEAFRKALKLTGNQAPVIFHPVGYPAR